MGEEVARLPDGERKLESRRWRAFAWLTGEIAGLPRHVSQHPGGMIVSTRPLIELVPVQPAAMAGRQLCQWDKDSCSDAGFLKIDLLGLGMLSAVEDCVEQIARTHGEIIDLSRIPFDDAEVFDDIQRADTVGAFQIESRAQMQSLLRTKPENLDDLTVQVALVRPGPIQGKAVHPYIDARERLREDPSYVWPVDHELLREPLRSTFGVVVFQDQVLEVAIALAGFTVGEAEGLRRAMSRKRSHDALEAYRERFVAGAAEKGVDAETADTVFDKLVGFSGFGFPKAHAAAFGLLAYQSQWLRHHYPAEFLCALLNAQPMGFYPPATLVRDAQRHGVEVLPADVNLSGAQCVDRVTEAVRIGITTSPRSGWTTPRRSSPSGRRTGRSATSPISRAGRGSRATGSRRSSRAAPATASGSPRRDLLWELGLVFRAQSVPGTEGEAKQLPLSLEPTAETPALRDLTRWERMLADYRHTGMSVGTHPLALLRPHLPAGTLSSAELHEQRARAAGRVRGDDGRAPAPVDREGDRLHAPRGRARPGEPHRPAAGLRPAPRDGARRAARPRPRPLRAGRGEPERPRLGARVARPARAPGGGGRLRLGVAPAAALVRPSLRLLCSQRWHASRTTRSASPGSSTTYGTREWERFDGRRWNASGSKCIFDSSASTSATAIASSSGRRAWSLHTRARPSLARIVVAGDVAHARPPCRDDRVGRSSIDGPPASRHPRSRRFPDASFDAVGLLRRSAEPTWSARADRRPTRRELLSWSTERAAGASVRA